MGATGKGYDRGLGAVPFWVFLKKDSLMLRIVRENEVIKLFVGEKMVWQGSIAEWSRVLGTPSVRTFKEVG